MFYEFGLNLCQYHVHGCDILDILIKKLIEKKTMADACGIEDLVQYFSGILHAELAESKYHLMGT